MGEFIKVNKEKQEPETEILIRIGTLRNIASDGSKAQSIPRIRVFINGEEVKHLTGFAFKCNMKKGPQIKIKKWALDHYDKQEDA